MAEDDGLRARKQRATREAIHRIAVRRALADGLHNVTTAEISAEAGVSARTFFNYFPSKEDAMLGFHEDLPTDRELAAFAESDDADLLRELTYLLRNVFSSTEARDLLHDRRELIHRHPELLHRQMSRVMAMEQRIIPVVADRMRTLDRFHGLADYTAAAQVLVLLASSSVRITVRNAASAARPLATAAEDDRALEATLATLREVVSRIR